jgi:branched-chain amino acid transport system substrate-binding protein
MVSDYSPGHDAETAVLEGYKQAGGHIIASIRFPVAQPDFSVYVQRAKDANPDGIYVWIPAGAQPAALGKAIAENGIDARKTMVLSDGNLTDDSALKSMGDVALGFVEPCLGVEKRVCSRLRGDFERAPPRCPLNRRLGRDAFDL